MQFNKMLNCFTPQFSVLHIVYFCLLNSHGGICALCVEHYLSAKSLSMYSNQIYLIMFHFSYER